MGKDNYDPANLFARQTAYQQTYQNPLQDRPEQCSIVSTYEGRNVRNGCGLVSTINLKNLAEKQGFEQIAHDSLNFRQHGLDLVHKHQSVAVVKEAVGVDPSRAVLAFLKQAVAKPFETIMGSLPDVSKIDLKTYNAAGVEREPRLQTLNSLLDTEEKSKHLEENHAALNIRSILTVFASYSWFSHDNRGSPVKIVFNYGTDLLNAMFTGTALVFGRFKNSPYFGSSLDDNNVAGHEFTHQVIDNIAQLVYSRQPGALNEHFADVFGLISDFLRNKLSIEQAEAEDKLRMGDLFIKDLNNIKYSLRSFSNPGEALGNGKNAHPLLGEDIQPDNLTYMKDTDEDEGGVHIYSGALNRAFYLAAKQLGDYNWWGLGAVWFLTLFRLDPNASFDQFKEEIVKSAEQLFGEGRVKSAIVNAFIVVGLYDNNFSDPSQFMQVPNPR
ncbi:MAG: M4 family metallopeptidase [Parachlamydiales bacterium]|jgi:Zn-dependent metalloprotease